MSRTRESGETPMDCAGLSGLNRVGVVWTWGEVEEALACQSSSSAVIRSEGAATAGCLPSPTTTMAPVDNGWGLPLGLPRRSPASEGALGISASTCSTFLRRSILENPRRLSSSASAERSVRAYVAKLSSDPPWL